MILSVTFAIFSLIFAVEAGISGELQLEVTCFNHPSRRDRWGKSCDILSDCDPHFQFCVTDENPSQKKCNIGIYQKYFENAVMLGACRDNTAEPNFPARIKFPVSTSKSRLYLVITITEKNDWSASKLIDELVFPVLPGAETQPNGTAIGKLTPLEITKRVFTGGDKPRVEISAGFQCSKNRYGSLCDVECKPTDSYVCQTNGARKCREGWRGDKCDQLDSCALKPCKEWATCEQGKDTFRCVCNGRAGLQCQADFDPCYDHQCKNGGICRNDNDRPKCDCPVGWLGEKCEQRNPCLNPNPCEPHGTCKVNGLNFTCICESGWRGERCSLVIPTTKTTTAKTTTVTKAATSTTTAKTTTKTTFLIPSSSNQRDDATAPTDRVMLVEKKDHTAIIIIAVLSVLLVAVFTSGLAFFLIRRMKRNQKKHRQIVRGNLTLLSEERKASSYESAYDDPDELVLAFDSEIYTEPGAVYSFVARDQDGTIEVVVPPVPPAMSERPPQLPRISLESSTSMNSNRVLYVRSSAQ